MDLGPLVGTYDSALSSIVKMKRADVNSKNFPPFPREKGSPSPSLGALLDPSCQETIPSACSDKLIPENVFFPSCPFPPPSCYNVFSIFNPRPSKLPSSLQTLSDEWSFENQNLNARLLQFACLPSFICTNFAKAHKALHAFCQGSVILSDKYDFIPFHLTNDCWSLYKWINDIRLHIIITVDGVLASNR